MGVRSATPQVVLKSTLLRAGSLVQGGGKIWKRDTETSACMVPRTIDPGQHRMSVELDYSFVSSRLDFRFCE